ncbi:MAG: hypothetical protein ACKO5F_13170 [Synechococcus sp.]
MAKLEDVLLPHAKRLGIRAGELVVALTQYGAKELADWAEAHEAADPGSVWHTGDVPDWLETYLPEREGI